jgi:alkylation response protein AidB-like acyl-CoA dehydrogenase
MNLAATPYNDSDEFFIEVLDARAHGAELSLRAAQSALLHPGARGYLMESGVQRRVRESHFVAIVTPAIKHLRSEIARLSQEEMPA